MPLFNLFIKRSSYIR